MVFKDINVFISSSKPFYTLLDIYSIFVDLRNVSPTFSEVIMHLIILFVFDDDPFIDVGHEFSMISSWLLDLHKLNLLLQEFYFLFRLEPILLYLVSSLLLQLNCFFGLLFSLLFLLGFIFVYSSLTFSSYHSFLLSYCFSLSLLSGLSCKSFSFQSFSFSLLFCFNFFALGLFSF